MDDQQTYERQTPLPPEFPISLTAEVQEAGSSVENPLGLSKKQTEENIRASLNGKAKLSLQSSQGL